MAKAIYSARNALKIKEIVMKRRTGKSWLSPLTLRLSWSENPRFMWYLQKANSTFHFPPTVCQRGWRGGKTSHRSSRCQRSGICPFFFFSFHAHTHHLLVLMCSSFPGYTLIFQKAQKRFVFAHLAQLNPPDRSYQSLMVLCGYFRTQ